MAGQEEGTVSFAPEKQNGDEEGRQGEQRRAAAGPEYSVMEGLSLREVRIDVSRKR